MLTYSGRSGGSQLAIGEPFEISLVTQSDGHGRRSFFLTTFPVEFMLGRRSFLGGIYCNMTDIEQILQCSKPLFEEHAGDDDFAYTFAGSIFAASFRERLFLITARHVLDRMEPGAARTWLNGRSLAFSQVLRPDAWDEPYGDLAMLELDISKLDAKDREELRPIVLDAQLNYSLITLVKDSRLVVQGYPSELMQLDFDQPPQITPRGYMTDAKYVGESGSGLHLVHYCPGPRPVRSHDGLSEGV